MGPAPVFGGGMGPAYRSTARHRAQRSICAPSVPSHRSAFDSLQCACVT